MQQQEGSASGKVVRNGSADGCRLPGADAGNATRANLVARVRATETEAADLRRQLAKASEMTAKAIEHAAGLSRDAAALARIARTEAAEARDAAQARRRLSAAELARAQAAEELRKVQAEAVVLRARLAAAGEDRRRLALEAEALKRSTSSFKGLAGALESTRRELAAATSEATIEGTRHHHARHLLAETRRDLLECLKVRYLSEGIAEDASRTVASLARNSRFRLDRPLRGMLRMLSAKRARRVGQPCPLFDEGWYLARYPDVAEGTWDPWAHYLFVGAAQGRDPGPGFDTSWYLGCHQDVREEGVNPLVHYWERGRAEGWAPIPDGTEAHFDSAYYLAENKDVASRGIDPWAHYVTFGEREGRRPTPRFDPAFYYERYPDIAEAGLSAFRHYVTQGVLEGRLQSDGELPPPVAARPLLLGSVAAEIRRSVEPGEFFEEFTPPAVDARKLVRAIAFYLPQFHAIPENDAWWGPGFTEWTNLSRGAPRFRGHTQPRVPRDLGFYDLSRVDTIARQVALAVAAGLSGFCFYYYWFDRQRLLERPLEAFLGSDIDFPFCLMWANENWTRRWDGLDEEVLARQSYGEADEEHLLADLNRYFRDPRYIRVGDRPLFIVYRPGLIPECRDTVERWRRWFRTNGCDPLILGVHAFGFSDPLAEGLDGAVEFPPHKVAAGLPPINAGLEVLDPDFAGHVVSYRDVVEASLAEPAPDYPLIRTAMPSWDNDARRQGRGTVYHGSTPVLYEEWLRGLVGFARENPTWGQPTVFINAWNEWAEAAYLEPDTHNGFAYLNATANAIHAPGARRFEKIVLIGHDTAPHGSQMLLQAIGRTMGERLNAVVHVATLDGGAMDARYRSHFPGYEVLGRDPRNWKARLAYLRERGFATAIVNTAVSGVLVGPLKEHGFRVVSLVHEMPALLAEYRLHDQCRAIARHADAVVFASDMVADAFEGFVGGRVQGRRIVRPQGSYQDLKPTLLAHAIKASLGMDADAPLIVGMGYGDRRKGFDRFLETAARVRAARPDSRFAWVGHLHPDMRALAHEHERHSGPGPDVILVPHTDAPADYLSASAIYLMTSREDPYPTVVIEAMLLGLPVIAFAASIGCEDLVAAYGTVVPEDDVGAMVEAVLDTLAADPAVLASGAVQRREASAAAYRWRPYVHDLVATACPDMPRISAVVPNYDYARHLPARLASIREQTLPVAETVVLDDASRDDSAAVIAAQSAAWPGEYAVIINERNSGDVFAQWRLGLAATRGDLVWIAEADDGADREFLRSAASMMSCGGVAFAFADSRQIDGDGAALAESYGYYFDTVEKGAFADSFVIDGGEFARRFLCVRNLVLNVSGVLWRRDALEAALEASGRVAVPGHPDGFRLARDWVAYLAAALSGGSVAYVASPLNVHRRHSGGVTSSLRAARHLAEVEAVHAYARSRIDLGSATLRAQAAYVDELRTQFGLAETDPR